MKSTSYFQYSLEPQFASDINAQTAAKPRAGALLRVEYADKQYGYADLMPWPEFGDSELEQQLDFLKKGKLTNLLERSLACAEADFQLRQEKRSAFSAETNLKNHFLIQDLSVLDADWLSQLSSQGYSSLKIKMTPDFTESVASLLQIFNESALNVRLDFNASLNWAQFEAFTKAIPFEHRRRIEFIEDPLPWNPVLWKKAAQFFSLALDFEATKVQWQSMVDAPFRYLILKPVRMNPAAVIERAFEFDCRIVVTNSFDHQVGMAHAARVAQDISAKSPGLLVDSGITSQIYKANQFTADFLTEGAFFKGTKGLGIGFDSQLEKTPWLMLK